MLLFSVQFFCIYCKSVWIGVVSHFIPSLLRFTTVRYNHWKIWCHIHIQTLASSKLQICYSHFALRNKTRLNRVCHHQVGQEQPKEDNTTPSKWPTVWRKNLQPEMKKPVTGNGKSTVCMLFKCDWLAHCQMSKIRGDVRFIRPKMPNWVSVFWYR